jgi:phosphonoacetaldehyde hydrolase
VFLFFNLWIKGIKPTMEETRKTMGMMKWEHIRTMLQMDRICQEFELKNAGVTAVGIVEGSSEMGLTKAEWEALSEEEQAEKAREVEARYLEAGADHVIADIRGVLKLMGLEA